jgi:protocatechuate 3,4-dioxygenase beta subunit
MNGTGRVKTWVTAPRAYNMWFYFDHPTTLGSQALFSTGADHVYLLPGAYDGPYSGIQARYNGVFVGKIWPSFGEWHMVTLTNDGATARYYLDGIEVASASAAPNPPGSARVLELSGASMGCDALLDGSICDFRVYSDGLTPDEITALYTEERYCGGADRPVSVGTLVWLDEDGDGQQDVGEPPVRGATVRLQDAQGAPVVDADGQPVPALTTGSDGLYHFGNLAAGDYRIEVRPPERFAYAATTPAADPNPDSNPSNSDSNGVPIPHSGGSIPVPPGTLVRIMDDGDPGFSQVGFSRVTTYGYGFNGDYYQAAVGSGERIATWQFQDLTPGRYRVSVTYPVRGLVATDAPYTVTVFDDARQIVRINERSTPNDFTDQGVGWEDLGWFNAVDGTLKVELTNAANSYVQADAVRIEYVGHAAAPVVVRSPVFTLARGAEPTAELFADATPDQDGRRDDDGNMTIDFGFVRPAAIGNFVWVDENSDGYQDAGEPGIPNVRILLKDSAGNVLFETRTDSHGGYLFSGLQPGSYFVDVDDGTLPVGMTQTPPATLAGSDFGNQDHGGNGYAVTVGPGAENLTADFGYNTNPADDVNNPPSGATAALGDRVWIDVDGDGAQDPDEVGVRGATVQLITAGSDGLFGTADDTVAASKTTNDNGTYLFDNLAPGAYWVRMSSSASGASHDVLNLSLYTQTGDPDHFGTTGGSNDNLATTPVVLGPGDVFLNVDFGYQPTGAALGSIGDTVWFDADLDGNGPALPDMPTFGNPAGSPVTQGRGGAADPAEYGIPGVTVALIRDADGDGRYDIGADPIIATDVTDANGQYLFQGLPVNDGDGDADYLVWVNDTQHVLGELSPTYDDDGVLPTPNRSVAAISPATPHRRDQDFGYGPAPYGSIGDTIWWDVDNSGGDQSTQGPEPGLAGVSVRLYLDRDGNGQPDDLDGDGAPDRVAGTVTDGAGQYLFRGLPFDTYIVEVDTATLPVGFSTTPTYDPDGGADSRSQATIDAASPHNRAQDFSYTKPGVGSIGDTIWGDLDSSGGDQSTQGAEPGLAGVKVVLLNASYTVLATTVTDGQGRYLFTNLPVDADGEVYWVEVETQSLPDGFAFTPTYDPDGGTLNRSTVTLFDVTPHNRNQDFSYPPAARLLYSIGDTVWFDVNSSGGAQSTQGAEPGLPAVRVSLYDAGNALVATTFTDGAGNYLFTGLQAGTYTVAVDTGTLPAYVRTVPTYELDGGTDSRATVSIGAGNPHPRNLDFSYPPAAQGLIGDTVWFDLNNSGGDQSTQGAEPGIEGVVMELLVNGQVVRTTITDENGHYAFGNLPLDTTFQVRVAASNFTPGGVLQGMAETYAAGATVGGNQGNLVNLTTANPINLYRDLNANGRVDPGEPRISTQTTASAIDAGAYGPDGVYLFTSLPAGSYVVDVTDSAGLLHGYWHSLGAAGADNNSQVDPYAVSLAAGGENLSADFGYYVEPACLGNFAWYDEDEDGLQGATESGFDGVPVQLVVTYPNGATTTLKVVTGDNPTQAGAQQGWYSFCNLLLDEDYRLGSSAGAPAPNQPAHVISVPEAPTGYSPTRIGGADGDETTGPLNDSNNHAGTVGAPVQGLSDVLQRVDPNDEPAIASYDFGFKTTPLAVLLAGFDASAQPDHILVAWETVSEVDNTGFNLYRSASESAPGELLAFLPSQAPGSLQGFAYSVQDEAVMPGVTYWYWLEAVDIHGTATRHGPVSATYETPTAVALTSLGTEPGPGQGEAVWWLALVVGLACAAAIGLKRRPAL